MSAFVDQHVAEVDAGSGTRVSFARSLLGRPAGYLTISFLLAIVVVCLAASVLAPFDPREQDLTRVLDGPTGHNLLGTDTLGRDVLSRLMYGGRRSLLSIVEGLAVVLVIGVPLGLVAGYVSGWSDRLISRIAEMVLAIPAIILVLVVLAVVPGNADAAMVAFGVLGAPQIVRVVRAATLKIRGDLYITAARVSGLTHARILARHILPRVTGPIIVQATLFCAYALLFETGIAYLGLAGDPANPTWGGMVGEASTVIEQQSWLLVPPGLLIASMILAFSILGDAIRDAAVGHSAPARRSARSRSANQIEPSPAADRHSVKSREPGPALLAVRGLSVTATGGSGETRIVDGVSFDVLPGETVGIVGESGCGKSVTALALLRLLPDALQVVDGKAVLAGADLLSLSDRGFDRLRGSTLAYVAQEPHASLDPTFTIGSQLTEVVRRHDKVTRAQARARAIELLELVELQQPQSVARSRAHELSGGMAQRVALALALAGRPRLLVADEPTTALDVTVQAEILTLLRRVQAETEMAIVVITHNWGVVADLCDRNVVMYAGQVVEQADAQAMFDRPLHPYTLGLLESHPSLVEARQPLRSLSGSVPTPGDWPTGCRFAPRCRFVSDECRSRPIPLEGLEADRDSRCIHIEQVESTVVA